MKFLNAAQVGDKIGLMRKSSGNLHFYVNGVDQGVAAHNVYKVVVVVMVVVGSGNDIGDGDDDDNGNGGGGER